MLDYISGAKLQSYKVFLKLFIPIANLNQPIFWSSADLAPVKWMKTSGTFSGSVLSGPSLIDWLINVFQAYEVYYIDLHRSRPSSLIMYPRFIPGNPKRALSHGGKKTLSSTPWHCFRLNQEKTYYKNNYITNQVKSAFSFVIQYHAIVAIRACVDRN